MRRAATARTFIFKYGSMPIEEAEKSMRVCVKECVPALKALDPKPLLVADAA